MSMVCLHCSAVRTEFFRKQQAGTAEKQKLLQQQQQQQQSGLPQGAVAQPQTTAPAQASGPPAPISVVVAGRLS